MAMHYRSAAMIFAIPAMLLLAATRGLAQQTDARISLRKADAYFMAGWQTADLEGLNDLLEARAIPAFHEDFLTLGLGFNVWLGRWLVGAEAHWLLERKRTTVDFERKLAGNFGTLNAGYTLQIGKLQIYPIAGIGGGSMQLETVERATPSFAEVLDEPRRSSQLGQLYLLGQGALRVDYPIQLSRKGATASGVSIGFQAGYTLDFGHWDWELGVRHSLARALLAASPPVYLGNL